MESLEVIEKVVIPHQPVNIQFRKVVSIVENKIRQLPDHKVGNAYPLKHSFAEGLYIRELAVPAGILTVTRCHKFAHPAFLLKGELSVLEERGIRNVKAPAYFITPKGTKRIIYHHTEVILVTVHATNKTDIQEIEKELVGEDFEPIIDIESEEIKIKDFIKEIKEKENKDAETLA